MRRELKIARTLIHDLEATLGLQSKQNKGDNAAVTAISMKPPLAQIEQEIEEKNKIIKMQQMEIKRLRVDIEMGSRPSSSQKLPPVSPVQQAV